MMAVGLRNLLSIVLQRLEEQDRSGASDEACAMVSTVLLASHILCLTKHMVLAKASSRVDRWILAHVSYSSPPVTSRRVY
jgi:hypothetical protein